MSLRSAARGGALALDLLFPPACVYCGCDLALGAGTVPLCGHCQRLLYRQLRAGTGRCATCGRLLLPEQESLCLSCRDAAPAFRSHESLFDYGGVLEEVLHAFKFQGFAGLARLFADLLAARIAVRYRETVVVPVPARPQRIRRYGYDTVDLVTRALQRRHGLPVQRLLRRAGGRQQKGLDLQARRGNLHGSYSLQQPPPAGRPLLLIDDVYTTGATVNECASVLAAGGAPIVQALTLTQD